VGSSKNAEIATHPVVYIKPAEEKQTIRYCGRKIQYICTYIKMVCQ
jgi:hypothetical protein